MIYVRPNGTPYSRPERAANAWRDEIADDANGAFDAAFRAALREPAKKPNTSTPA